MEETTIGARGEAGVFWSQMAISAGGAVIVVGGLWLLSDRDGPYHPVYPAAQLEVPFYDGS